MVLRGLPGSRTVQADTAAAQAGGLGANGEQLQANEIIYNKRGIGYFVASDAERKIREMRHNQFVEEVLPAVFKEMHLLGVGIDELTKAYTLYISTIK